MLPALPPLAAQADSHSVSSVFVYSGVLIVLLFVAFAGYYAFKRWMNQDEKSGGGGFTLSDLRELHRQGKMSDQEYEQTRAMMVGAARKMSENLPDVLPRRATKPSKGEGPASPPVP